MPFALLSAENRIIERMRSFNPPITAAFLASLCGNLSASKLSQALKGIRPLSNEEGLHVLAVLEQLRELVQAAKPIPIAFQNPSVIRDLIKLLYEGTLRAVVRYNETDAADARGTTLTGDKAGAADASESPANERRFFSSKKQQHQ